MAAMLFVLALLSLPTANAVFVKFDNCLNQAIVNSANPQQLQFVPYFMDAHFAEDGRHTLNLTIYGNVSGQAETGVYPPPNSPRWNNTHDNFGKIVDSTDNYTTLFSTTRVLSYTPYDAKPSRLCGASINGTCPWGPLFDGNRSDPYSLHAFTVSHNFDSSYAFSTFFAELRVQSGDTGGQPLACISSSITPDLGKKLSDAIAYIPLAILALVGIATVLAARFSPWSSSDFFYWTSNYGRDDDVLRLVTPGFGDCLQYIQFIVLAGSLSLNYPGYYQPVVSQASWSILMFNESFVSRGNGTHSLIDGIYAVNGTYGLTRLSQLRGMTHDMDVWAGMAVWMLVLIGSVTILCQIGFGTSWLVRRILDTPEEDLQSKNLHFTAGNVVRIMFNFFLLPLVTLSMFQLVTANHAPSSVVAMAVILIVAVICFAGWLFHLIFATRPRVHLFDHLPLLLLYGPLYNTYSDEAAPYAFIPFVLTFIRGIAMGAVQPSGIVQLVVLAICEVILILTLHAFRPFHNLTSMNAYHTFFSVIRLITTLLSVAFVPSLAVPETSKGWIGYAILLLHAIVLVFGFFLNAIQTLVEIFARLAQPAAGREARGGLATVFGVRQLSKRVRRNDARASMGSDATVLTEPKANNAGRRSRSISASSAMILRSASNNHRGSENYDQFSQGEGSMISGTSPGPSTPGGAQSPFSFVPGANSSSGQGRRVALGGKNLEPTDPYYRPPRFRRPTSGSGQNESPFMEGGGDPQRTSSQIPLNNIGEGGSAFSPNRNSITAAFLRNFRSDDSDSASGDPRRLNTDYTTRESDFYYGVRGPALSSMPSRRLKTGPADPMSPVASAKGWFSNMFAPKAKDKKKGFEVVRSTPLHLLQEQEEEPPALAQNPYMDSPERPRPSQARGFSEAGTDSGESYHTNDGPSRRGHMRQVSDAPPMLGPIATGGSLHMPSRSTSNSSSAHHPHPPRRSSKRLSGADTASSPKPNISRVSSFRGPGNFDPDARVPFHTPELPRRESAASSLFADQEGIIAVGETPAFALYPPPNAQFAPPEPPVSTGRVRHHIASESIHEPIYVGNIHQGSAAELVDPDRRSKDWSKGPSRF
jgi:hypothetical protein